MLKLLKELTACCANKVSRPRSELLPRYYLRKFASINMKLHKDYQHKKFRNTLFVKKFEEHQLKKRFWLFRNKYVNLTGSLVIIFGLIYFFFYSPVFLLNKIAISGLRDIAPQEIKDIVQTQQNQRRWLIFRQNNFFWFNKEELKNTLNNKYSPEILTVKKRLFHTLKIYLSERASALTWISGDKFYYINLEGQIISEVPFKDPNPNFPRIYDESSKPVSAGQTVIQPAQIRFIIDVLTKLPQKVGEIVINSFRLPNNGSSEIKLVTNQGWQVYFNTNLNVASQLDKLVLVYEKKIKGEGLKNLEYIDLRFGDKVFYK